MKKIICILFAVIMTFASASAVFAAEEGWFYGSAGWWYQNADGSYPADTWKEIDGNWYRFDEEGFMRTGVIEESYGISYYCAANGAMATGWVYDEGSWYYCYSNGIMAKGWIKENGFWYYLEDDGKMATGWLLYDGYWYYLREDGTMATGWLTIDGKDYYFSLSGKAAPESYVRQLAWMVLDSVGWDLHAAFEWSVGMGYDRYLDIGYNNADSATYSYLHYVGNCISMASTFYWMAKEVGCEAYVIYGQVPYRSGGYGAHAWVEIVVDGVHWVCDPDYEMQEGLNGYFIYYGQSGTWRYEYGYVLSDY